MRVSLAQPRDPRARAAQQVAPSPVSLASSGGPRVVLGGESGGMQPVVPAADTLFGARGVALASPDGPLVVADTGHHRVLIWRRAPERDGTPADIVFGQPDFTSEGRNAGRDAPCETTCNVPVGVAMRDGMLAVADSWNHRVLVWRTIPDRSNVPPDVVLGQRARDAGRMNRGESVGADTLYWCSGVAFTERGLLVADTGNRRVLVWDTLPERDGAPADRVLGQRDFQTRDENAGGAIGAGGMRWPHAVLVCGDALVVADAGNNRIMLWHRVPEENGAPCDAILGQRDANSGDHNGGAYWPTSETLNMPYGCAVARDALVVADTANSRLVGWRLSELAAGAPATGLVAQPDFLTKGDNRWGRAVRDSLCWPYGVAASGDTLAIADSGNSRVALWDLA